MILNNLSCYYQEFDFNLILLVVIVIISVNPNFKFHNVLIFVILYLHSSGIGHLYSSPVSSISPGSSSSLSAKQSIYSFS